MAQKSTKRLIDQNEFNLKDLATVLCPIENARGLPNACYIDSKAHAYEQKQVFTQGWVCVGFAIDAPNKGDVFPFECASMPLLMVRNAAHGLQIFHNVCRHRGHVLVDAPVNVKKAIACPYHRWTYGLDGALTATPHIGGAGKHACLGFDKEDVRLREVRSAEWFGLVFVDLSDAAENFGTFISPLAERWSAFTNLSLTHTGDDCSVEFVLDCNWKLAVENYCESYHLPWVHPGLNSYSPLQQHHNIVAATYSGQRSDKYTPSGANGNAEFPGAPSLPDFWNTGAEYLSLFPNVLLGIHRDHFFAVLIQPESPGRTKERMEIFYFDEVVKNEMFAAARKTNRELWQSVFAEDQPVVEGMHRGRSSPGFDGGIFSPAMDRPTHAFHIWIAKAMLDGRFSTRRPVE